MNTQQLNRIAHAHGIDQDLMHHRLATSKVKISSARYEIGVGYVGHTSEGEEKILYYIHYKDGGKGNQPYWGKRAKLLAALERNKSKVAKSPVRLIIPRPGDVLNLSPQDFK